MNSFILGSSSASEILLSRAAALALIEVVLLGIMACGLSVYLCYCADFLRYMFFAQGWV